MTIKDLPEDIKQSIISLVKEREQIAFESGFRSFKEIDTNYGNWKEAIEEGLTEEFDIFYEPVDLDKI